MVDTVCIEVLRHLAEAGLPPAVAVLCHLLPIIDWEAPILTCYRKVIRWSTGRRLHYEELRRYPRIDTDWAHTDRNIALEHYAHRVTILDSCVELTVEVELYKAVEIYYLCILLCIFSTLSFAICRILAPLVKVGTLILITQCRIYRIRSQPALICSQEVLIFLACKGLSTTLLKEDVEILKLSIQRTLVIYSRQSIKLSTQSRKAVAVCLLLQLTRRLKVDIEWMKRNSRVCVVRI